MNTDTRLIPLTQGKFATVDAIDYDRLMQWKWCARKQVTKSRILWYALRNEYHSSTQRSSTVYMHREIAKRMKLPWARVYDHRDRNGLNNSRANIRKSNHSLNGANSTKRANGTSNYKGVNWDTQNSKWHAQISFHCKTRNLGLFDSELKAHRAYRRSARKLFGEFAHC